MTPPPPARDKVPGSAPPAQDRVRVPCSADRRQGDDVTAGLEADFARWNRVNDPSPRRPRTMSPVLPRWPRLKFPAQRAAARVTTSPRVLVAGFAAAGKLESTELAVNPPGCASFVAGSGGEEKLQIMVTEGLGHWGPNRVSAGGAGR